MLAQLLARLQDDAKDRLVETPREDFLKVQGEALAYKKLHDMIFNFKIIE